jgi:DNA-binding NarL/FixJ family response regulator
VNPIWIVEPIHLSRGDWETAAEIEEAVIESIRIVLVDLPQLAADMLERAVAEQVDMLVVARLRSSSTLPRAARRTAPDVVIMGMTGPELPPECMELFGENLTLTVLGVQKRQGLAHLYQLRPYHRELGEVAPDELLREIRNATDVAPF